VAGLPCARRPFPTRRSSDLAPPGGPMRNASIVLIVAFSAACGGRQPGSGNTGGQQVSLQITTTGAGLVRGAGPDCRGTCTVQMRSEEHTSKLQSRFDIVCRL